MAAQALTHSQRVTRLYRRALKHSLSWMVSRRSWRPEALKIRARFDAAKDVRDARQAATLLEKGEAEFEVLKHPDPYIMPTSPDGSKWERNLPPPPHVLEMTPEEQQWLSDYMKHAPR